MEGRRERGQEEGKVCGGTGEMGPWVKCLDFDPQHSHQNPGDICCPNRGVVDAGCIVKLNCQTVGSVRYSVSK